MSAWGLIPAAGAGERLMMHDGIPKAMRPVAGSAMFVHSLRAFDAVDAIEGAVLVVDELWMEHALSELVKESLRIKLELIGGGPSRQASVAQGLKAVPPTVDAVVVHDAARPLVDPQLVQRVLMALDEADGAVCAVALEDTLKRADDLVVTQTVPRDGLWRAQTPQAFRAAVLRDAHARAREDAFEGTDDAVLVERAGGHVTLVDGDPRNVKITTVGDLALAEMLLEEGAR